MNTFHEKSLRLEAEAEDRFYRKSNRLLRDINATEDDLRDEKERRDKIKNRRDE